jgi:tetratricopeptide (TPR) repeat protein
MMNRFFITLLCSVLFLLQLGCKPETANTTNSTANQPVNQVINKPEHANTNANSEHKKAEAPKEYTDANEALTDAKKLIDSGKEKLAVDVLKQAIKINPELAEAHFQLGVAYALIENADESKIIGDNKTKSSKKVDATVELTNSEKSFAEAVKAYQKLLAKNPKDDSAQFNLGRCLNKLNKDKDAEKALRKAASMKPDNAEYQMEVGAILIKFAKYQEAIGILKKVQKLDPGNGQVDSLMEKAEAGAKRENFGTKPKDKPAGK